jgi:hypothetical protein
VLLAKPKLTTGRFQGNPNIKQRFQVGFWVVVTHCVYVCGCCEGSGEGSGVIVCGWGGFKTGICCLDG